MSLVVSIIAKDIYIEIEEIENEIESSYSDSLGSERWREELWGHSIMKSIGCDMIYELNVKNVYAFDEDISKLEIEFNKIMENIELISYLTKIKTEAIEFRVRNALEAIRVAQKHSDKVGVALW